MSGAVLTSAAVTVPGYRPRCGPLARALLGVLSPVVPQHLLLAVNDGQQVHRPPPDTHQRRQRAARVVTLEIRPLVAMAQEQLAAVIVVGVLDEDERVAEVGQLEQDLVLDLVELARVDLVVPGPLVERSVAGPTPKAPLASCCPFQAFSCMARLAVWACHPFSPLGGAVLCLPRDCGKRGRLLPIY